MAADTETTPLLAREGQEGEIDTASPSSTLPDEESSGGNVVVRILICAFLIALSFSFTQVPYVGSNTLSLCPIIDSRAFVFKKSD